MVSPLLGIVLAMGGAGLAYGGRNALDDFFEEQRRGKRIGRLNDIWENSIFGSARGPGALDQLNEDDQFGGGVMLGEQPGRSRPRSPETDFTGLGSALETVPQTSALPGQSGGQRMPGRRGIFRLAFDLMGEGDQAGAAGAGLLQSEFGRMNASREAAIDREIADRRRAEDKEFARETATTLFERRQELQSNEFEERRRIEAEASRQKVAQEVRARQLEVARQTGQLAPGMSVLDVATAYPPAAGSTYATNAEGGYVTDAQGRLIQVPERNSPLWRQDVTELREAFELSATLEEILTLVDRHGTELTGPMAARLNSLRTRATLLMKNKEKLGALQGPDIEIISDYLGDPVGLGATIGFNDTVKASLMNALADSRDHLQNKVTDTAHYPGISEVRGAAVRQRAARSVPFGAPAEFEVIGEVPVERPAAQPSGRARTGMRRN